jgi:hypothetical protein
MSTHFRHLVGGKRRAVALVALGTLTVGLSACGSSTGADKAITTIPPSGSTSTTKPVAPHVLVATFADNGGTLTVQPQNRIRVVLAGTSWSQSTSDASVVVATSKSKTLPASTGCVQGQGCGSVTVFYQALKDGTAHILGDRGSCAGAAPSCKTGASAFKMTIVVAKAPKST